MDVELVDAAVSWGVHNQRAAGTSTAVPSTPHARVVVAHVAAVDILHATAIAPKLVTSNTPATTPLQPSTFVAGVHQVFVVVVHGVRLQVGICGVRLVDLNDPLHLQSALSVRCGRNKG